MAVAGGQQRFYLRVRMQICEQSLPEASFGTGPLVNMDIGTEIQYVGLLLAENVSVGGRQVGKVGKW